MNNETGNNFWLYIIAAILGAFVAVVVTSIEEIVLKGDEQRTHNVQIQEAPSEIEFDAKGYTIVNGERTILETSGHLYPGTLGKAQKYCSIVPDVQESWFVDGNFNCLSIVLGWEAQRKIQ